MLENKNLVFLSCVIPEYDRGGGVERCVRKEESSLDYCRGNMNMTWLHQLIFSIFFELWGEVEEMDGSRISAML